MFEAGYGEIGPLLEQLEERQEPYLAQVPRSHCYWPADVAVSTQTKPNGRPRRYPAIADAKPKPVSAGNWSMQIKRRKTIPLPRCNRATVQAAALRVRAVHHRSYHRQGPLRWLLVEKFGDGTIKYYVSNLPERTSPRELVHLAHQCWKVEQGYQQLKEELGFDHFEGRSWRGLHHHLVFLFYGLRLPHTPETVSSKKLYPHSSPSAALAQCSH